MNVRAQVVPGSAEHLLPRQQAQAGSKQPVHGQARELLQLRRNTHDQTTADAVSRVAQRLHRPARSTCSTCTLTSR